MNSSIGTVALAAIALAGMTACEPAPPPPVLVVSSTATGDDANPGDGVCETETGNEECTLAAAVQEANALGRAVVEVPWLGHSSYPELNATVTGDVSMIASGVPVGALVEIDSVDITVEPSATLRSDGVGFGYEAAVEVDGTLVLTGGGILPTSDGIHIGQSGTVVLKNTLVWRVSGDGPLITNHGQLVTAYVTLSRHYGSAPLLVTAPGATTTLAATRFTSEEPTTGCAGEAPISLGYNAAGDSTCGLTSVGDQPDSPIGDDPFLPFQGSPAIDAIPIGVLGCGDPGQVDVIGKSRPFDGDDDGVPACDIGAWEWNPTP